MPSYLKEQLKVAVFIDTSGSIGDDELMRFKSECVGIAKSFESIDMIIGYCDTEVKGKPLEVANGNVAKIMEYKALGGGGTDMTKCFTWINKNAPENELIVIFTDGYTPFPTKKLVGNRNVLWVISSGGLDAEKVVKQWNGEAIGEVIKIDEVD
jgi:predicted metal-dependent peptidase